MIDPPAFMCGTAALDVSCDQRIGGKETYLVMANMARMLLLNVLSTLSSYIVSFDYAEGEAELTLISVIDSSMICLLALLTKISS
jgi:hypothetical protein